MISLLSLALIALAAQSAPPAAPATATATHELHATHWFNNPVFRLHDNRTVIVFFFKTDAPREAARQTERIIERLNRLIKRTDLVLIGLTADPAHETERFIRRHRIRFTVGARSRSARDFGVDSLPALRIIRRTSAGPTSEVIDEKALPDVRPAAPATNDPNAKLIQELLSALENPPPGADTSALTTAVRRLYELMPAEDFVAFASATAPVTEDRWVRAYLMDSADRASGAARDAADRTLSARAHLDYRENPDARQWEPYRKYLADKTARKNAAALENTYIEHLVDDPVATLIRRTATEDLWRAPDRNTARSAPLNIIQIDPDASIRMIAAMALSEVCTKGDTHAAEFLESLAATEPNAVKTRPVMQRAAQIIREGRTDADTKPPQT